MTLGEVYRGIRLDLRAYGENVEKLFTVEKGGDPGKIALKVGRVQRGSKSTAKDALR